MTARGNDVVMCGSHNVMLYSRAYHTKFYLGCSSLLAVGRAREPVWMETKLGCLLLQAAEPFMLWDRAWEHWTRRPGPYVTPYSFYPHSNCPGPEEERANTRSLPAWSFRTPLWWQFTEIEEEISSSCSAALFRDMIFHRRRVPHSKLFYFLPLFTMATAGSKRSLLNVPDDSDPPQTPNKPRKCIEPCFGC